MMEPSQEQLELLARIVAATESEEIDCDALLNHVAAYLEAHAGGAPLPPELRAAAQHLEVCPQCREEFEALLRGVDRSST